MTDAALHLKTTRANIAPQIKTLEKRLGLRLFDWAPGKPTRLTLTGRLFHSHALRVLNEWERFLSSLEQLQDPPFPGVFRLAVPAYLRRLEFIDQLEERLPRGTKLRLVEMNSEGAASLVTAGEVDAVLSVSPSATKRVKEYELCRRRPTLLLRKGHPLVGASSAPVSSKELQSLSLLRLDRIRYPALNKIVRNLIGKRAQWAPDDTFERFSSVLDRLATDSEADGTIVIEGGCSFGENLETLEIEAPAQPIYLLTPAGQKHPVVSLLTSTPRNRMQVVNLELKPVLTFVELVRCGSRVDLALSREVTQAAITQSIQALQTSLQCDLLDGGKEIELTAQGRLFLRKAASFVDMLEDGYTQITADRRMSEGEIVVGVETDRYSDLIRRAGRPFAEESGGARIVCVDATEREAHDLLQRRNVDFFLGSGNSLTGGAHEVDICEFEQIEGPGVRAVVVAGSKLEQLECLTLPDLRDQPLGVLAADFERGIDKVLDGADILGNLRTLAGSMTSLFSDILRGECLGLAVGYLDLPEGLVDLPVEGCDPVADELTACRLCWRKGVNRRTLHMARRALLAELRNSECSSTSQPAS